MDNQVVDENEKNEEAEMKTEESTEQDSDQSSEQTETQKQEIDYKEKYYYLAAEMENQKKRFEREKQNLNKWGNERILSELIEVVDNLQRTTMALQNEDDQKIKNIKIGIDMVEKQFLDVLNKNGLELIEAIDKEFDPNFHEAMGQKEIEGKNEGIVVEEFQTGYILNGRVLRASKVIVSK